MRARAARAAALFAGRAAKHLLEEIAERRTVHACAVATIGEFEAGIPVGRRAKILPGAVCAFLAQVVIGGALFRIGQHGVGFVHFGHAIGRVGFLADVGMVFARELAIRFLDLVRSGVLVDAEYLVIVLEFHATGS